MEIGSRLKNARTEMGLTQEKVAEEIGVSRQSISNWENNRSYPDIVSVIKLSDLYSVSLDELLKEDKNMIRHLDESTNVIAARERLLNRIILGVYFGFWVLILLFFWLIGVRFDAFQREWRGGHRETILFSIVFPLCIAIIAGFIECRRVLKHRWFFIPLSGVLLVMLDMFTAELEDMTWIWTEMGTGFNLGQLVMAYFVENDFIDWIILFFICGCGGCALGMFFGLFIRNAIIVKRIERNENNNAVVGEDAHV